MANDSQIFDAMVGAVRAADRIGYADWGFPQVTVSAEYKSVLRVRRTGFRSVAANSSNTEDERIVMYQMALTVKDNDYNVLKRRIHNLECHLINLFHNTRIGGLTQPMTTLLETGRDDYANQESREHTVYLTGQFSYLFVPGELPETD